MTSPLTLIGTDDRVDVNIVRNGDDDAGVAVAEAVAKILCLCHRPPVPVRLSV